MAEHALGLTEVETVGDLMTASLAPGFDDTAEQLRRMLVLSAVAHESDAPISSLRPRHPRGVPATGATQQALAAQGVEINGTCHFDPAHFYAGAEHLEACLTGQATQMAYSRARRFWKVGDDIWIATTDWRGYVDGLGNSDFARELVARLQDAGIVSAQVSVQDRSGFDLRITIREEGLVPDVERLIRETELLFVRSVIPAPETAGADS